MLMLGILFLMPACAPQSPLPEKPVSEQHDEPQALWPQFLGPRRDGISHETGLNVDWEKRPPKVLWDVPIGGGFSSASIVGNRLFTMAQQDGRDIVFCLDARSGEELWRFDTKLAYRDREQQGDGPRATPTWHDGRIYCLMPGSDLYCIEADSGHFVWKTNLYETFDTGDHQEKKYYWGMSGSPLVEGGLVVVQPGGNQGNSLIALDKDTGEPVWSTGDDPPGYGSPIAVTITGRRQIIGTTGSSFLGVNPRDGKILWRFEFGFGNCNCATPLWINDRLFVCSAYGVGAALLEIVEEDSRWDVRPVWQTKKLQNHFATSMIVDGHIYGCHGDLGATMLRCIDLADGKLKWVEREPGRCCLLAAEGHLICLSETGVLRLLEANPDRYVEKGLIEGLLTRKSWTPPVLVNRRLYVRDQKHLICLDLAAEAE